MNLMENRELLKGSPIKLGVIGVGSIGTVHLDVLRSPEQKAFKLVAISDLKPLNVNGVDFSVDHKKLLENPSILAVSINTPPNTHYQLVMEALNAGKHVLVEKPPALTVAQCQEMVQLAEEKNKVLFMAFHARYHPEVDAAAKELRNKQINEINIIYGEWVLNYHDPRGWIFDPEIAGGGVLMDSGINALSIVTKVIPDIKLKVESARFDKPSDFKVETRADVKFSFGEIGKGTLSMDWMKKGPEVRQVVFRTRSDEYAVDIVRNILTKDGEIIGGRKNDGQVVDQNSEYKGVYEDFARHLSTNTSLVSAKELEFIEQAYKL